MAIKNPLMVKQVLGNTVLELEAKSGESLRVKDIFIYSPTLEQYLTVTIEKTSVGYFRTSGLLGGHLSLQALGGQHSHDVKINSTAISTPLNQQLRNAYDSVTPDIGMVTDNIAVDNTVFRSLFQWAKSNPPAMTILGLLKHKGLFTGYPIAEGQTLTLTGVAEANAIQVVVYEVGDPGDFTETQENGSESSEYMFLNYGRVESAVTGTAVTLYNQAQDPSEFPEFPFGKDVPAKKVINLLGVMASPVLDWDAATDFTRSRYLKFAKEREVLFDDDKNGLLLYSNSVLDVADTVVGEGFSFMGNYSDVDNKPPLFFDPAIPFEGGEELNIHIDTEQSTSPGSISQALCEICLIEKVTSI